MELLLLKGPLVLLQNMSLIIRYLIASGILAFTVSSCFLQMNLGTLIAIAEITQFLALFSLISIRDFPSSINNLFNSQSLMNFNFIPLDRISWFSCQDLSKIDVLENNVLYHPSINCILFYCNIISIFSASMIPIFIYIVSFLIYYKIGKCLKNNLLWGGFIGVLLADFINCLVILFIQLIYVLLI